MKDLELVKDLKAKLKDDESALRKLKIIEEDLKGLDVFIGFFLSEKIDELLEITYDDLSASEQKQFKSKARYNAMIKTVKRWAEDNEKN